MATGSTSGSIWVRKMRTVFRRLDVRGQGFLLIEDLLDVATSIFNVFPKMQLYKTDQLVHSLVVFYGALASHEDRKPATLPKINEYRFVENLKNALTGEFGNNLEANFLTPMFTAMDQDDDGFVTINEFEALMHGWHAIANDFNVVFKVYADGAKLSKAAFVELMTDFFRGEDGKSKVNRLWGPLLGYKRAEDYGTLDCGPVWEGRMRSMFRRLDFTETMKLRSSNFLHIAHSLAQRGHWEKKRNELVIRNMVQLWVKYFSVDKDGNHLDEIREIEFIHNLRDMVNGDYRHEVDQLGWTYFKALEADNSGFITQATYKNLQEVWKVGREEGEGMFKAIDTSKDGKLSSDEFMHAWNEYFLNEDPNCPFRMFFGPIISRQTEAK